MWCVCNHSGQRLRTWIPVLILIQCGLICLYIGIIQDKSRTASSSYSDKLTGSTIQVKYFHQKELDANLEHSKLASGPKLGHNKDRTNTQGSLSNEANGSNEKGNKNRWKHSNRNESSIAYIITGKTIGNYLKWNKTSVNGVALQDGKIVRFQSGHTASSRVVAERHKSDTKNGKPLSAETQTLQSISTSTGAVVRERVAPLLMTQLPLAASNTTLHHNRLDAPPSKKRNAMSKGSSISTNTNSNGPLNETKHMKGDKAKLEDSRWRLDAAPQNHKHLSGPYAKLNIESSLSPSSVKHGQIPQTNDSILVHPEESNKNATVNNRTVIKQNPSSPESKSSAHKVIVNNVTAWPLPADEYSTTQTLYGIHTHSRNYRSTLSNSSHGSNLFLAYNPFMPPMFHLLEDNATYFTHHGRNLKCMNEGTENVFLQGKQEACICKPAWHGEHCSVPDTAMYTSALRYINTLQISSKPRRIINAINFNLEWELLEARLEELYDLVDVFLIVESNYTMYGDAKPLRLLERMKKGYLKAFHHKIAYLFVHSFPIGGRENGWIADQYARMPIGKQGLGQIEGIRPDDVFIYTDADEIPSRDVLLFLKLHNGYPEPFGLALRWSVFGFFWKQYDLTRIMVGCSIKMLRSVFQSDVYKLRTGTFQIQLEETEGVKEFTNDGGVMFEWYFGDGGAHAGWHCSWCMSPDRIQIKLTSAINADFPRWGDYPEKRDITYIRNLIKTGTWFDDKTTFNSLVDLEADPNLAPGYLLANFRQYRHLLNLKYAG